MTRTNGISNKLLAGIQAPLAALVYTLVNTGSFDRTEAALLAVAALGAIFAWLAPADSTTTTNAGGTT